MEIAEVEVRRGPTDPNRLDAGSDASHQRTGAEARRCTGDRPEDLPGRSLSLNRAMPEGPVGTEEEPRRAPCTPGDRSRTFLGAASLVFPKDLKAGHTARRFPQ